MTGEGMTSVSVSYETRRHLNTMRSLGNHKSIDALLMHLAKEYKMQKMQGVTDDLRARIGELEGVDAELLVQRLGLSPFPV